MMRSVVVVDHYLRWNKALSGAISAPLSTGENAGSQLAKIYGK